MIESMNTRGQYAARSIAESKAFGNMKVLGADRVSYKDWSEKLKSSMD